jgi:vitamin B12 transporter
MAAGVFSFYYPGRAEVRFVPAAILWLLLAVIFHCPAVAQSSVKIAGYVYDDVDGHPLPQATVEISGAEYLILTDQLGYFYFENLPDGRYNIHVTAEGYRPGKIENIDVLTEITSRVTVRLARKIYHLSDTRVSGQYLPALAGDLKTINREEIRELGVNTVAEVLEKIEGVYVQETGPAGGRVEVSIRGCDPKHVLVLLDGQRINAAGSGTADLGTVPLGMVEKVEIYRGGRSARFGPDALGGVVNIISHTIGRDDIPEIASRKYWGKWKTDLYDLTLINAVPFDGVTGKLAYSHRGTSGDFHYDYRVNPRPDITHQYSGSRQNAASRSDNYFWSISRNFRGITLLSLSGQVYRSENGLPGSVSSPDSTAWKKDNRTLVSGRIRHVGSENYALELELGFSRFMQYFNNMDHSREPQRYDIRYTNDIFNLQATGNRNLWRGNELRGGLGARRDILYHDDYYRTGMSMNRTVRDNIGIFVSDHQSVELTAWPLFDVANFNISARWDNTDTKKDSTSWQDRDESNRIENFSPGVSASLSREGKIGLVIRGSYGLSCRLPSINSLFWKGDARSRGNPGLKPERSEHSDIGCEINLDWWAEISGGITYFHYYVRDLIEWQPGYHGVWQPVNLAGARITGHEDFVRIMMFNDRLRLDYQNTITVAENRKPGHNSFNKYLTYRPHYITRLGASLHIWKLKGSYSVRLVDIRYNREANTKWYDAYRVDDMSLGFDTRISRFRFETTYGVRNLHGEHYILIGHYPMPGREWGIDVSLSYRME